MTGSRIIGLSVGAAIGLTVSVAPDSLPQAIRDSPAIALLSFLAGLIVGVIVHELGHWAAGAAAGLEFRRIMAGALMLAKESGGYRFGFLPGRLFSGGHTLMVPRTPANLRRRYVLFIAGGPLATALLFLLVAELPWGVATAGLLLANLALAFFSWVPLSIRGHFTDGKALLLLARQGPSAERLAAILYLTAIDSSGIEPRAWPQDIMDKLSVPAADAALQAGSRYLLYIYTYDGGSTAEAAAALEQVLATAAGMHAELRRAVFTEAGFFQGVFVRNAALARAWLEDARKVKGAAPKKDWDASPLAAIALAEGNTGQAREHLFRALAFLDSQSGSSGSVAASRSRLAALMD